jgi:hypothetical protein
MAIEAVQLPAPALFVVVLVVLLLLPQPAAVNAASVTAAVMMRFI